MDMTIDLNDFDLVAPSKIENISTNDKTAFIDIEVEHDNTFFFKSDDDSFILSHNCDGSNICSMLLGWWYKLCPSLYNKHKIYRLNTPIVIIKDSKDNIKKWFFNLNDFKKWESTNTDQKLKIIYLKGLGSLETKDLDFIIQQQGFDSLLEEYTLDDASDEYFKNWLGPDAEPRKKYMKEYDFDINTI